MAKPKSSMERPARPRITDLPREEWDFLALGDEPFERMVISAYEHVRSCPELRTLIEGWHNRRIHEIDCPDPFESMPNVKFVVRGAELADPWRLQLVATDRTFTIFDALNLSEEYFHDAQPSDYMTRMLYFLAGSVPAPILERGASVLAMCPVAFEKPWRKLCDRSKTILQTSLAPSFSKKAVVPVPGVRWRAGEVSRVRIRLATKDDNPDPRSVFTDFQSYIRNNLHLLQNPGYRMFSIDWSQSRPQIKKEFSEWVDKADPNLPARPSRPGRSIAAVKDCLRMLAAYRLANAGYSHGEARKLIQTTHGRDIPTTELPNYSDVRSWNRAVRNCGALLARQDLLDAIAGRWNQHLAALYR